MTEKDTTHYEFYSDYLKHITTLSIGSIVVVAAFLDAPLPVFDYSQFGGRTFNLLPFLILLSIFLGLLLLVLATLFSTLALRGALQNVLDNAGRINEKSQMFAKYSLYSLLGGVLSLALYTFFIVLSNLD